MVKNFNKLMRKKICDDIENYIFYRGISLQEAINEYMNIIYQLEDVNDKNIDVFRSYVATLGYMDAYKLYSYKHRNNTIADVDIDTYALLTSLNDDSDLLSEVSANPDFFGRIIESIYEFYNMNGLGKVLVIRALNKYDNDRISNISSLHRIDLESYTSPITLDRVINNYKNQENHYNEVMELDFQEGLVESINGFLSNLAIVDFDNFKNLVMEIAKMDYEGSKYIEDKVYYDVIQNHIEFYENSYESEIIDRFLKDKNFIIEAIWMMVCYYVDHQYGEIEIKKDKNVELKFCKNTKRGL